MWGILRIMPKREGQRQGEQAKEGVEEGRTAQGNGERGRMGLVDP